MPAWLNAGWATDEMRLVECFNSLIRNSREGMRTRRKTDSQGSPALSLLNAAEVVGITGLTGDRLRKSAGRHPVEQPTTFNGDQSHEPPRRSTLRFHRICSLSLTRQSNNRATCCGA